MKSKNDFGQFRRKIFLHTIAVLAATAAVIYLTYAVLLRGRFANGMVALFQNTLGMDYAAALRFYERTFRSHMDAIILLSLLLVAAGLFYFYLRWLTRYFEDISRGMDALLQDVAGEISLPPELLPIERKMNLAKHTIDRQKSDMLLAEQKKNDLVMYLAHDLKTPLASSISYLNLLRDEKQLSEELREKYLTIALAKSERLEDLLPSRKILGKKGKVWYHKRYGIYRFEESREIRTQGDTQAGRTAQENGKNGKRNRGINRSTAESRKRNMDSVSTRGRKFAGAKKVRTKAGQPHGPYSGRTRKYPKGNRREDTGGFRDHRQAVDIGTDAAVHSEAVSQGNKRANTVGLHEALGHELPASSEACPEAESYRHLKVEKRGISRNFKACGGGECHNLLGR